MKCWLMLEEDGRFSCLQLKCPQSCLESRSRLTRVVGHTDEVHPIEGDFAIIQDRDLGCLQCSLDLIYMLIFLVIPIREYHSMRGSDPIEFTSNTLVIYQRSVEEISWDDHHFTLECIDEVDELPSMLYSIDIAIVSIGNHDDPLTVPMVGGSDIHTIALYDCSEALRDSIDIECESQEYPEYEIYFMRQELP